MVHTICKMDQGALALPSWWGINEDATQTQGHSRFGKGRFQDLFMSIINSTLQLANISCDYKVPTLSKSWMACSRISMPRG
jgi:hypothetical protein